MPKTIIGTTNIATKTETEGGQPERFQDSMIASFKLDPVGELSGSGKSMIVATTEGFIQVGEYKVSINVIKKK